MSGARPSSLLRTLSLQASFNRVGMQRMGWWFCLAPWLRRKSPEGRAAWFARPRAVFNTNPYLAPVLLGVRCRVEEQHSADLADRVEESMQRSLGALGDSLGWRASRPLWFLGLALAGAVAGPVAVLAGWLIFAAAVLAIHHRGLDWGYAWGLDAVDRIAELPLHGLAAAGRRAAGVLAGAVTVGLLTLTLASGMETLALVSTVVALGAGLAVARMRRAPEGFLLLLLVGVLLYARWSGDFPEAVLTWR